MFNTTNSKNRGTPKTIEDVTSADYTINFYPAVFENLPFPAILLDNNSHIKNMNRLAAGLFCDSHLSGNDPHSIKEAPAWLAEELEAFAEAGVPEYIFEKSLEQTGSVHHYEVKLLKMNGFVKNLAKTLVILNDITKYKQAEEEKRLALLELNQIFLTAADGLLVIDKNYNILRANDTFIHLAAINKEELAVAGKKCFEVLPGPCCHTPACTLNRILNGEDRVEADVEKLRKDGVKIPCTVTATPYRSQNGELLGIVENIRNISDREKAELALQESEKWYRAVFENTGTATMIIEEDTVISRVNTRFEELSGCAGEELEGKKSWKDFFYKDDLERMMEYHRSRRLDPASVPKQYETRFIDVFGNIKDVLMNIDLIPGTCKSVASLLDITEGKRSENHFRREAARAELLAEVSHMLVKTGMNYKKVLVRVAQRIAELIGDACVIRLLSEDGQWLNPVAAYHRKPEALDLFRDMISSLPQRTNEVLNGEVIQSGQPLLIPVVLPEHVRLLTNKEHHPYLDAFRIKSLFIAPLFVNNYIVGTLGISRDFPERPYQEDDLEFFKDLVDRLSMAVTNAKLHKDNLLQLKTLNALCTNAQKIAHNLDLGELSRDIVRTCVEVFGVRLAWLSRVDEGQNIQLLNSYPFDNDTPRKIVAQWHGLPLGQGVTRRALRSGSAAVFNNLDGDNETNSMNKDEVGEGFCASAAFPLISREKPFGTLNLYSDKKGYFTPRRIEFFQAYAHQAAAALQNARLFEDAHRRLDRLQALRNIDMAITASLDPRVTFNVILDQVTTHLGIHAADILLLNPYTQHLEYTAGRGFHSKSIEYTNRRMGEGNPGRIAKERRLLHIPSLPEAGESFSRRQLLENENFITYYGVPLIAKGQVKGVMEVFHRTPLEPDPEWIDFLEALAGQAAIAIDNAALFNDLQRTNVELMLAYDATIEGWSRALDLRDKETEGHTRRVAEATLILAREMGVKEEELVHIRRGALLHDIGKMGIPDHILLKPGPLSEEEWLIMRKHPVFAYGMLSPIDYLRPAMDIPYCHHEKWDGTGYPRGLKGDQIPLAARIFAVVDVWDALRSERPYRSAWPEEKVIEHIRSLSGTHFDPVVVKTFLKIDWLESLP